MTKTNDNIYWRYKKKKPPVDENAHRNGKVIIVKPATKPAPKKRKAKFEMTEELAKKYTDRHVTNKQLRWLQDERP